MPKVSQEYRDARRDHVLEAASRCFMRSGFDGTSMQDLFCEADMSAGAVYSYFDGKGDIMIAIAERNMKVVIDLIHELAAQPRELGLGAALAEVLNTVLAKHVERDIGPLAVQVWAQVQRDPVLAQRFEPHVQRMRADLVQVVRSYQADGTLPAEASAEALAKFLTAIVPGFILQLALFGADDGADVPAAVASLWPRCG